MNERKNADCKNIHHVLGWCALVGSAFLSSALLRRNFVGSDFVGSTFLGSAFLCSVFLSYDRLVVIMIIIGVSPNFLFSYIRGTFFDARILFVHSIRRCDSFRILILYLVSFLLVIIRWSFSLIQISYFIFVRMFLEILHTSTTYIALTTDLRRKLDN